MAARKKKRTKPYFDKEAGERPIEYIETFCTHVEGELAGDPLLLEDFQKDILRKAFGTMNAEGLRQYRTVYIEVPRKNGKSAFCSAIGSYLFMGDNEPGAQVYAAAADKDQARTVFEVTKKMIEQNHFVVTSFLK